MEKTHSSQELSNNILQAILIISDKRISKTLYSTTIQGIIKKCLDTSTGKYSLQYQDSIILAYAISPSVQYSKDTLVYVFVPNGNLSEYKVILGSDKQLSVNFVENYKGQDGEYEDTGRSFVPEVNQIRLSSYQKPDLENGSPYKSLITGLLNESLTALIKNANHLKISGIVQTNLENAQKRKGRYGVRIILLMKNSATGEAELQEYYFDSNSFIGDPYNYINPTSQSIFLPFESENFVKIKSIESFVEGFPIQKDDEQPPIDIVITDFSINGSYKLSDLEIASVGVVLISKKGFTLKNDKDSVNITANLRVKGKPIDLKEQGAKVYWFRQDARITTSSSTYMQCGGIGWDCLNPYCSFINYTFNNSIAPTDETTFKCVIVYDNNNYFKEFEIMNSTAQYDFYIESSEGTEFQYSTGHPTLTLKNRKQTSGEYTYKWQVRNNQNIVKDLERDTDRENKIENLRAVNRIIKRAVNKKAEDKEDDIYWKTKIIGKLNIIIEDKDKDIIKDEKISTEDIKKIINSYKTGDDDTYKTVYDRINNDITNYLNYLQRIVNNIIYHVNLHEIINFSVFSCSVYDSNNLFVGSANITIKNTKAPSLGYNLVINNGDQVFLYNEAGDSLQNDSIDEPYDISDLTYSLYYNGRKIEEKDLNGVEATWKIPVSNTLLVGSGTVEDDYYIKTGPKLSFNVKNKYNSNYNNNDILLFLKYKKQVFQAKTYFTFNKLGLNGTNGTGIQFKLEMENNKDTVLTYDNSGNLYNNKNINPQVWRNGNKITLSESKNEVKYSILQNKDNNFQSLYSISAPTPANNILTLNRKINETNINDIEFDKINNIIEAIYNSGNYKYYADLPIITIIEKFTHDSYRVTYKSGTGFRYVVYKNDGTRPSYNNRLPFEIKILKKFDAGWEDVTTYSKLGFTFKWEKCGNNIASINPTEIDKMTYNCSATPIKKITNSNTYNDALLLTIKKDNTVFAYVHIPIHFMLNRYENAALNDWNGSALDIDENGKYILAPQIGAGKKDSNNANTFTGIVMGIEQTQSNNKIQTQTGLFGYAGGVRSIFLDADTGNALFGLADKGGQIKINVASGNAIIKSSDYPIDKTTGKPAGMEIKFSGKPYIKFGSGDFTVNSDGHIHAVGGGDIAGWQISYDSLSKNTPADTEKKVLGAYVEINSSPSKRAFQAGIRDKEKDILDINFYVTHKGYLYSKHGKIAGWTIESNRLYNGNVGMAPNNWISDSSKNYQTGVFWAGEPSNSNPVTIGGIKFQQRNFFVTYNGYLFAKSGNIGGWNIGPDRLSKITSFSDVGMAVNDDEETSPICFWAGTPGKKNFYVRRDGYLFSRYGKIGNWYLGNGGLYCPPQEEDKEIIIEESYTYSQRIDYLKKRKLILTDAMNDTTDKVKKANYKKRRDNIIIPELKKLEAIIKSGKKKLKDVIVYDVKSRGSDWEEKTVDRYYNNSKDGLYLGSDGIRLGSFFSVTESGGLTVTNGTIGGIKICQRGLTSDNWRVTADGTAYFNQAMINNTDVVDSIIKNASHISGSSGGGGISGGGMHMGSGGPSSSSMSPGVMANDDQDWDTYIDEKIKNAIDSMSKSAVIKALKDGGADINFTNLTVIAEKFNGHSMEKSGSDLATETWVTNNFAKTSDIPSTPSTST